MCIAGNRLSVVAEVPAPVAGALRTLKRRIRPPGTGVPGAGAPANLVFSPKLPSLDVVHRDPQAAIAFLPAPAPDGGTTTGPGTDPGATTSLPDRIRAIWWYHSIELPGGVTTPGFYDHRPLVARYGLPADLSGARVLDVATFDGFWAFEMERRGGTVTATDIERASELDLPPQAREALIASGLDRASGAGFALAHEARGSRVERVISDVYDLDPAALGLFDFVHVADLLLHLESPLAALRAIRRVSRDKALIVDCFDPDLVSGQTRYLGGWSGAVWWLPSLDTLAQMVIDAGFADVELQLVYALGNDGKPRGLWRAALLAHV